MNKIEIVEKLQKDQVLELVEMLLKRVNFKNIRREDSIIRAEEGSTFGGIDHAFLCFSEHLSGGVEMESIFQLVQNIRDKEAVHVITIVSNHNITSGFQKLLNTRFPHVKFEYFGREDVIALVDKEFPDYWRHDDSALIEYEHQYESVRESENQLKLLHLPTDKMQKLMNIFIQPTLVEEMEDAQTHTLMRKRLEMKDLVESMKNAIISGLAGSGKSTLLYNIGLMISQANATLNTGEKKKLPIFLTAMDLINHQKEVKESIIDKTNTLGLPWLELVEKYEITLLVDSIDEFEADRQEKVIRQLENLSKNKGIRYILATRNDNMFQEHISRKDAHCCSISRFNVEQIRRFVNAFLPDEEKANDLLDALRENKLIERLPITPLTLSLISILFDETDYEIPATITDIYAKFNDLVIGRAIVSSKIEFIDVNFRERILSMYGYHLMTREDHQPLTYDEFIKFFVDKFADKSKQIKGVSFEEGLDYIVKNTGILYIKDNTYVCFAHDTYMEYYAAVEIFNFHRADEQLLVDNFFDMMWQNVAVFYAGITKDMDDFAKKINNKLKEAGLVVEYIAGIQGAGYLLQALYISDDTVRRDVISTALDLSLNTNEAFKKMATLPDTMFKNYRIPIVQLLSLLHFYEMFNSITLKTPLELCFKKLRDEYEQVLDDEHFDKALLPALGYRLACLAFTLDSKRIGNDEPLTYLIGQKQLLSDVNIHSLLGISMEVLGKLKYKDLRDSLRKEYRALDEVSQQLIIDNAAKARFSPIDTIHPLRRVKLFVEGKTDAMLLEHAFITLTHGRFPYWNVEMATQNGVTGSTHAVTKAIEAGINYSETYDYLIGIYDHDKAGLAAYRTLQKDYEEIEVDCIKKNKIKGNVYLLCIPVPGEMSQYVQDRQDFNFFEIEHYFGHDYLRRNEMVRETPIPDILEIIDSKKVSFATAMKETNPAIFRYFVDLFKKIDEITGVYVEYEE